MFQQRHIRDRSERPPEAQLQKMKGDLAVERELSSQRATSPMREALVPEIPQKKPTGARTQYRLLAFAVWP